MSDKKISKTTEIRLRVGLDAENIPQSLEWLSEDSEQTPDFQPCKAVLLSLFDREHNDTLKIDLWTQDLQVQEMDRFMYQSLRAMAETYYRATQNKELANAMHQFSEYFGEKTEVIPASGKFSEPDKG